MVAIIFMLFISFSLSKALAENPFNPHSSFIMTHEEFNTWVKSQLDYEQAASEENSYIHKASFVTPLKIGITKNEYLLDAGDKITIKVYSDDRFSLKSFKIGIDGIVSLPLIGTIQASGKSCVELKNEIEEYLKEYLVEPIVDVKIDEHKPTVTYILGTVKRPGSYLQMAKESNIPEAKDTLVKEDYHLTTALANAGGVTENADLAHIHIFNKEKQKHRIVNLMNLLTLGDVDQDIQIQPHDLIYIPTLSSNQNISIDQLKLVAKSNIGQHQFPVRIYGLVKNPNIYEMDPANMSLHALLAKAGGPLLEARTSSITIARANSDGSLRKISVNSNETEVLLQPNDIVIVEKTKRILQINQLIGLVTRVLTPPLQGSFILRNIDQVWGINND